MLAAAPVCAADDSSAVQRWEIVTREADIVVLKNKRALPRAWLVGEVKVVTEEEALRKVRGETRSEFDPELVALVEVEQGSVPPPRLTGSLGSDASVAITSYNSGRIALETQAIRPTFLVVSEKYFPGWEAVVDGQPVPIYQTDYLLCGLPVPAGKHKVELNFHPRGATLGLIISFTTLALLVALGVFHLQTNPRGGRFRKIWRDLND
jgi:hypothetical protein